MSTTQTNLAEITQTSTDSNDDDTDDRSIREYVIDAVGNGGDLGEWDIDGAVVGDSETVMWFPDGCDDPMGVPVEEFAGDTEWEVGYTEVDGETEAVFGITNGEERHIINANKIEAVAYEMGVRTKELLKNARIRPDMAHYPVIFEMDDGRVMVAPIFTEWDEVRDRR